MKLPISRGWLVFLLVTAVLLAAGVGGYRYFGSNGAKPAWKLAKAETGLLTAVVSATGTLNPVVSVQVGSQVSGQVRETHVDFNSEVRAGQLIARIDPENFQHRVRQAEADLDAARAAVAVQQAEVIRSRANLDEAQRDYERKKLLVEKNFISPAERDKAGSALDASRAQLQVAQAQGRNSAALVRQREAQLAQARVDLERTAIRSPVDGIVVKRSIEPGQTVAASLQAPELFVIARNLTDMQVEAAIDEADVSRVHVDQKATFTVDAFPGRTFEGAVRQVRKAALVVSNVVTYTVVISAANPDLILLPGMTANVRIVTAEKDRVLKVANAALRFKPPSDERKSAGDKPAKGQGKGGNGGNGRVFVQDAEGKPKAVPVKTGLTDGAMTEILSGEIAEGTEIIVGAATTPKPPGGAPGPRLF
ncbi:MAG: efflux RND transporter periplasmic adaptor subunit [Candidatus Nitricoxidivorans perseverans]|uniref:Efflux RND transporter periplasmic adaptor subunit n=1 Tax=Candidatus Nitricoxidivorans perseverans TaxID=2975601 RepID=A0AA49FKJ5_9PROT|nr:MAG: efflux RND transporter periplasmic adaptor subunit [Candidatus Nitricoxidivorans perseverans]